MYSRLSIVVAACPTQFPSVSHREFTPISLEDYRWSDEVYQRWRHLSKDKNQMNLEWRNVESGDASKKKKKSWSGWSYGRKRRREREEGGRDERGGREWVQEERLEGERQYKGKTGEWYSIGWKIFLAIKRGLNGGGGRGGRGGDWRRRGSWGCQQASPSLQDPSDWRCFLWCVDMRNVHSGIDNQSSIHHYNHFVFTSSDRSLNQFVLFPFYAILFRSSSYLSSLSIDNESKCEGKRMEWREEGRGGFSLSKAIHSMAGKVAAQVFSILFFFFTRSILQWVIYSVEGRGREEHFFLLIDSSRQLLKWTQDESFFRFLSITQVPLSSLNNWEMREQKLPKTLPDSMFAENSMKVYEIFRDDYSFLELKVAFENMQRFRGQNSVAEVNFFILKTCVILSDSVTDNISPSLFCLFSSSTSSLEQWPNLREGGKEELLFSRRRMRRVVCVICA